MDLLNAVWGYQHEGYEHTVNTHINRLRGKNAEPKIIAGLFHWQGRLTGPLAGPTFTGHVTGSISLVPFSFIVHEPSGIIDCASDKSRLMSRKMYRSISVSLL